MSSSPHANIIYLATPYSHSDPAVRLKRFRLVTIEAARLVAEGHIVFSPITMTHPIDIVLADKEATLGSDYWLNYDSAFMEFCTELRILTLDGWQESSGVKREIAFFKERGRPISYIEPCAEDESRGHILTKNDALDTSDNQPYAAADLVTLRWDEDKDALVIGDGGLLDFGRLVKTGRRMIDDTRHIARLKAAIQHQGKLLS